MDNCYCGTTEGEKCDFSQWGKLESLQQRHDDSRNNCSDTLNIYGKKVVKFGVIHLTTALLAMEILVPVLVVSW